MGKQEMYNSILALSVGDAYGENETKILPQSAYKAGNVAGERKSILDEVGGYWPWTDDTAMAIGVFRTLSRYGTINQVELAKEFARNAKLDPQRGYGKGTARLLFTYLYDAENWREHSENWWGPGKGSLGNGSAMRDSIIGPYFGRDFSRIVREAESSAEVTHYSRDAIAGSIAVAIAASVVSFGNEDTYWNYILMFTPQGELRNAIRTVSGMVKATSWQVATEVGNGSVVSALDTVPFALWQAHQALGIGFMPAMKSIIEVGGDTDTIAAMVGGIVGNKLTIPEDLIEQTERLPEDIKP